MLEKKANILFLKSQPQLRSWWSAIFFLMRSFILVPIILPAQQMGAEVSTVLVRLFTWK